MLMTTMWLPGARVLDLRATRGNGPFQRFLGVVLHVNVDENGTPDSFWGADPDVNPDSACPNFQVFKDGSVTQLLPFNYQPWCQADGNSNYAAIETAGLPDEPLTAAQIASIVRILSIYRREMGLPLIPANTPGQRGLGIHAMGGAAWGGHSCPGTIRANQRTAILDAADGETTSSNTATPITQPSQEDEDMAKPYLHQMSDKKTFYIVDELVTTSTHVLDSKSLNAAHASGNYIPSSGLPGKLGLSDAQVRGTSHYSKG